MNFSLKLNTFLRLVAVGGGLAIGLLAPRHSFAQWNAYDAMMSNNSYSRGWVNPYNNTMSNIYQSNMNLITQQAINRSALFNSMVSSGTSLRAQRLKSMSKKERAAADRFAKYRGTMYNESSKSGTPAKLAAIFAKNTGVSVSQVTPVFRELLDLYKTQAAKQNAPSTDLARTIAYCISANYFYASGGRGVPESQVAKLRTKVRTALSEDTKFRSLSNAQKQELNETLVILTHFAALGIEVIVPKAPSAKRDEVKAGYRRLANVNLKGLIGVDVSRASFNDTGLVIAPA